MYLQPIASRPYTYHSFTATVYPSRKYIFIYLCQRLYRVVMTEKISYNLAWSYIYWFSSINLENQ